MEKFDLVVSGGGIGGSVAARFAAEHGFKTLLIEKGKVPRNKPCSGIQFGYFSKLLGAEPPRSALCKNELTQVEIVKPSGEKLLGKMPMLNFWRSTFDYWLNNVAADAGADFWDQTRLIDFHPEVDDKEIQLQVFSNGKKQDIRARYLIAADGMYSPIRKSLRPQDFAPRTEGGALNYYCHGSGNLDPNTLYMVNNIDFAPIMFAWVYLKDDQWVIGTGADDRLKERTNLFYRYVEERYGFKGEIVRREGFASPLVGGIWLGQDNILVTGDAAGLVDAYRGVGMDNAALSARFAIKAIIEAERSGKSAISTYKKLMQGLVNLMHRNEKRRAANFASNEELEASLASRKMLKGGLMMLAANQLNKILPPEKVILLPA